MSENKDKKSFTLLELLVAITIIAVLIGLGVGAINLIQAHARDTQRINDIKQLITAIDLYYQESQEPPGQSDGKGVHISPDCATNIKSDLINKSYTSKIPQDPIASTGCSRSETVGNDTDYFYGWDSARAGEDYCISINLLETPQAESSLRKLYGELQDTGIGHDSGIDDADFNYCFGNEWGLS